EVERPYAGPYAHRYAALHGQAGPPRHGAMPRPEEAGEGSVPRPFRYRQRQPIRAGLSLDGYHGGTARSGYPASQAAYGRRGIRERLQDQAYDRKIHRDTRLRGRDSERGKGDRHRDGAQRREPGRLLWQGGFWAIGLARFDRRRN